MLKKMLVHMLGVSLLAFVVLTFLAAPLLTKAINDTKSSVTAANVAQLSKAIELYYADNNSYPAVQGGGELVEELKSHGYISGGLLDPALIYYEPTANGEDYSLHFQN